MPFIRYTTGAIEEGPMYTSDKHHRLMKQAEYKTFNANINRPMKWTGNLYQTHLSTNSRSWEDFSQRFWKYNQTKKLTFKWHWPYTTPQDDRNQSKRITKSHTSLNKFRSRILQYVDCSKFKMSLHKHYTIFLSMILTLGHWQHPDKVSSYAST